MARVIEQAGISTGVLSWIPELSVAVGSPRVVGIAHPGSVPFGVPGDADGQRAVLEASLSIVAGVQEPGQRCDLPFEWPADARVPKPPTPPPIVSALRKRPWLYLKLLHGEIPRDTSPRESDPL